MRNICRVFCAAAAAILSQILMTSCNCREEMATLAGVDSYIQERPDSALAVLRCIDTLKLHSGAAKAKFSLLHAMALDKNYIDVTDTGIVYPAVKYYDRHGPVTLRSRARYYLGVSYLYRKEYDKAMGCFLSALEDSAVNPDNRFKAMANSGMSVIFSINRNFWQELEYAEAALRYAKLESDSISVSAYTGHLATCYANVGSRQKADSLYREFFSMPIYDTAAYFRRTLAFAKNLVLTSAGNAEEAIRQIEEVSSKSPESMTAETYYIYAYAHELAGNENTADAVLSALSENASGNQSYGSWRYYILRHKEKYKEALEELENTVIAQDSTVNIMLQQSLMKVQRDYYKTESILLNKSRALDNMKLAIVFALSLLIIAVILMLYLHRKRILERRIEELSSLQMESQMMLDMQASENSKLPALRKQLALIFKEKYKMINDLAYMSHSGNNSKEHVYDRVKTLVRDLENDDFAHDRFTEAVNESLDGIIDKLREDFPNQNKKDFHFAAYVIAGLDAKTISTLTGYSQGTVYTKKNRLKKAVSESESPYREMYLDFLA